MRQLWILFLLIPFHARADWPALHGGPAHTGYVGDALTFPLHLRWTVEFEDERIGTAVEPIISANRLFIGTHSGNLHALDARTGETLWQFRAGDGGAFLQSPVAGRGLVVAASTGGFLYGLDEASGRLIWSSFVERGGFSASPVLADEKIFAGTRGGQFVAVQETSGKLVWKMAVDAPIRQTAAVLNGRVYVTGEDLRVRCLDGQSGRLIWTSHPLSGQSARDYYPIVFARNGRTWVIVRTNPLAGMGQQISRDRTLLCRNAGIDDSSWKKLDAWIRSDAARGNETLWEAEQAAIIQQLKSDRIAQTFFLLDGETGGERADPSPILWIGGCQGVGVEPALTGDGRLLVFYRTAYGNWNHGVAPLVGLGLYDVDRNRIEPLHHQQGHQPAWNCFWGTADESQNFVVAGRTALLAHQGTMSGFDLEGNRLFPIFGKRDSYGGFANPAWARNEWHGPARSGVAIDGNSVYWQTGSRVLCLSAGTGTDERKIIRAGKQHPSETNRSRPVPEISRPDLFVRLQSAVEELLAEQWAPLFIEPGLAGTDFSFDRSEALFESLAWAYPHLSPALQKRVTERLLREIEQHAPFAASAGYSLTEGKRREWFSVPPELCRRVGADKAPHPFGGVYAFCLFAERSRQPELATRHWPKIKDAFAGFIKSGWQLDGQKGDLFANRYLASLIAFKKMAKIAGDAPAESAAQEKEDATARALMEWWSRAAGSGEALRTFGGSAELDPFINRGDPFSFAVAPHRHKIALFRDLTPEVAALAAARNGLAVSNLWRAFNAVYATWPLAGEERQVHSGENFVDPPDLALGGFKALAWLKGASFPELAAKIDLPFSRADLTYISKLAMALDADAAKDPPPANRIEAPPASVSGSQTTGALPAFPIGVWVQDPKNAGRYKAAGINLYVGLWRGPTDDQLAVLEKAGMPVICSQSRSGLAHKTNGLIVGWMQDDEPDNAQSLGQGRGYGPPILPTEILRRYEEMRAADPTRPILLNLGQGVAWDNYIGRGVRRNHPEDYPQYVQGGDMVSFDIYPAVHSDTNVAGKLEFVARGVERLVQWTGGVKPVWNCIECTRIENTRTRPTPHQVRAEVWMSIIHGSRGLIYFVHQFKPTFREAALLDDPEMLAAVTAINRRIAMLAPILKQPSVSGEVTVNISPENSPVAVMEKRTPDAIWLFAVAMRNQPAQARFTIRNLDRNGSVEVLDENRTVEMREGTFADDFKPYDVHLYRIGNR